MTSYFCQARFFLFLQTCWKIQNFSISNKLTKIHFVWSASLLLKLKRSFILLKSKIYIYHINNLYIFVTREAWNLYLTYLLPIFLFSFIIYLTIRFIFICRLSNKQLLINFYVEEVHCLFLVLKKAVFPYKNIGTVSRGIPMKIFGFE